MQHLKTSLILAALLFAASSAIATPGNNGEGNGGCGVGQTTNGCGGSGTQGPVGPMGPAGPQGATGPQGPQGVKGDTGATGAAGTNGINGTNGKDGLNGTNGINGSVGQSGANGVNGADGKSIKGDTGARGERGENAPDAVTVQQMTNSVAASQAQTQAQINSLRDEIKGVAKTAYSGVAAALALQMPAINPNKPDSTAVRIGVGSYKGQSAVGISFRRTNKAGDWSVTGGVAHTSQGTGLAVGVEHSF